MEGIYLQEEHPSTILSATESVISNHREVIINKFLPPALAEAVIFVSVCL